MVGVEGAVEGSRSSKGTWVKVAAATPPTPPPPLLPPLLLPLQPLPLLPTRTETNMYGNLKDL